MENSMRHQIISASTLQGADVQSTAGESIGEIKDLMVDVSSGEISYAVLSVSTGFLNLDSKYFAVPLGAFDFNHFNDDYNGNILQLDVSKEKLENSPGFDKDNWPSNPDFEFIDSVNSYYGVEGNRGYRSRVDSEFGESRLGNSGLGNSRLGDADMEETRLGDDRLGDSRYENSDLDDSRFDDSGLGDSRRDNTRL
jgi:sporulation protein YlmC with PRC-barrel domain